MVVKKTTWTVRTVDRNGEMNPLGLPVGLPSLDLHRRPPPTWPMPKSCQQHCILLFIDLGPPEMLACLPWLLSALLGALSSPQSNQSHQSSSHMFMISHDCWPQPPFCFAKFPMVCFFHPMFWSNNLFMVHPGADVQANRISNSDRKHMVKTPEFQCGHQSSFQDVPPMFFFYVGSIFNLIPGLLDVWNRLLSEET